MRFDKSFITKTLPEMSIAFGHFPENAVFSIDSREVRAGDIFVALKGVDRDGHEFVAKAFEKGAAGAIIAESKKEFELSGGNAIEFGVFALARSGKRAEAREDLNNLLRAPKTKYVSPYNIALIYNALDDRDKVFEWLEKGFAQRAPLMTFLKVEPKWNNLRSDPRFVDLIARMGLQL